MMKPDRSSARLGHTPPAASTPTKRSRQESVREARKLIQAGNARKALPLLIPYEKKARHDAELLLMLAIGYSAVMATKKAREHAERSFKLQPHPQKLMIIAQNLRIEGASDEAIAACDQIIEKYPKMASIAQVMKVGALEESGRFDEARSIIAPLLEDDSLPPLTEVSLQFEWAKLLVQEKRFDDANAQIDTLMDNPNVQEENKPGYLHLKAKSCDRQKDYPTAHEAARLANELGKVDFDADLYTEQVSLLIENWSRENIAKFPVADCQKELPIFIAGMPRSGTSLIDQIIDAHPLAAGVGELADIESFADQLERAYDSSLPIPECFGQFNDKAFTRTAEKYLRHCRKLSPRGTERIVNKALGNNKLVGLFSRMFPKCKIIHAMRDPRDVSISCFMGGFNNRLHAWTTQIDWSAHAWEQSERMMQHWKDALDIPILDVHYEALVADPETQFRRLIEFIGLEWDDACLSFHKTRRTVRTLSYDQVNRPIYKTSSGRHINYAAFIEGIQFPEYESPTR